MGPTKRTDDYAKQAVDETLAELKSDAGRGLSDAEAQDRVSRYGYNEIDEKEEPLRHRMNMVADAAIFSITPILDTTQLSTASRRRS